MSATEVLSLVGAITALVVAVGALWGSLGSARKNEVEILRGIIDELQEKCARLIEENSGLKVQIDDLRTENDSLKTQLDGLLARMREVEEENRRLTAKATSSRAKSKNRTVG